MEKILVTDLSEKEQAIWMPIVQRFAKKYGVNVEDFRCYRKEECIPFNSMSGERRVFSNFYECSLDYDRHWFGSSEQLYYYLCAGQRPDIQELILQQPNALSVKKLHLDDGCIGARWSKERLTNMKIAIETKFWQCAEFGSALMRTENYPLVEFAYWWDLFWGCTTNNDSDYYVGVNATGRILMGVREEERSKIAKNNEFVINYV